MVSPRDQETKCIITAVQLHWPLVQIGWMLAEAATEGEYTIRHVLFPWFAALVPAGQD